MNEKFGKRKRENNSLQIELEASLNTIDTRLSLAFERIDQKERDMVSLIEELKDHLKWTSSIKLLPNIIIQSSYNRKRLGSLNISPPYSPHCKYMSLSNNLSCLHCGRNGHLKRDYSSWRSSQEKISVYSRQEIAQKRGLAPILKSSNKGRTDLPHLESITLYTPLSAY